MTIGPTRDSKLKRKSDEIERLMEEFFEQGGEIGQADLRETKSVDLTFRHYAANAMEGVDGEADSD